MINWYINYHNSRFQGQQDSVKIKESCSIYANLNTIFKFAGMKSKLLLIKSKWKVSIMFCRTLNQIQVMTNRWVLNKGSRSVDYICPDCKLQRTAPLPGNRGKVGKYTIRSIVCEAPCHPVFQSYYYLLFGHLVIWSFGHIIPLFSTLLLTD